MKKYIALFAAALLMASCSDKAPDPVEEAIVREIMSMDEAFTKVLVKSGIVKVDSTTFRTELQRRKDAFDHKIKVESDLIVKYSAQNKRNNAERKRKALIRDYEIVRGLDSLENVLGARLDDVAYYEYVFTAEASNEEKRMTFKDAYAAVTPDGRPLGVASSSKDLHKRMGIAIPGYLEVLHGDAEMFDEPAEVEMEE